MMRLLWSDSLRFFFFTVNTPKAHPMQTNTWQYPALRQLHKKDSIWSGEWAECVNVWPVQRTRPTWQIDVKIIAAREEGNERWSEKGMTVCLFMCWENRCSYHDFFVRERCSVWDQSSPKPISEVGFVPGLHKVPLCVCQVSDCVCNVKVAVSDLDNMEEIKPNYRSKIAAIWNPKHFIQIVCLQIML